MPRNSEWTPVQSAGPCPLFEIGTPSSIPVAIIFAMSRRQMVMRSRDELQGALFGANLFGPNFEFLRACDEWAKVEAKGHLDIATPSLARVALAVGAVAPHDQAAIDEDGEMAPQRRRRHAMRPQASCWFDGKTTRSSPVSAVSG